MKKKGVETEVKKQVTKDVAVLPPVDLTPATEEEQKVLEESEVEIKKQKSKKSKITNLVFFIINLVVVAGILFYQLSNESIAPLSTLIGNIRPVWILAIILFILLFTIIETLVINAFIKSSTKKSRFFLALQTYSIGRYYDEITPMAAGGQPFQIYYLKARGLDAGSAISVPMTRYVVVQLAYMLFAVINIILCSKYSFMADQPAVMVFSIIGIIVNFVGLLVVFVLSVSKKIGKKIVINVLKLLQKMKIVKNYEKQYNRVMKVVNDYQTAMQQFTKDLGCFFYTLILSFIKYIIHFFLPVLIYFMFFGFDASVIIEIMVLSFMVEIAASYTPLPGGTGMTELSFTVVFAPIFGGMVFWAMLFWRLVTYYWGLIQGIFMIMYRYLVGDKKYEWLKKKWELEEESRDFRDKQLKGYKKKAKQILPKKN